VHQKYYLWMHVNSVVQFTFLGAYLYSSIQGLSIHCFLAQFWVLRRNLQSFGYSHFSPFAHLSTKCDFGYIHAYLHMIFWRIDRISIGFLHDSIFNNLFNFHLHPSSTLLVKTYWSFGYFPFLVLKATRIVSLILCTFWYL